MFTGFNLKYSNLKIKLLRVQNLKEIFMITQTICVIILQIDLN